MTEGGPSGEPRRRPSPPPSLADVTVQGVSFDAQRGTQVAAIEVVGPGSPARTVAVNGRIFVGRTCHDIDDAHRILIQGSNVSRDHCQVHFDPWMRRATLVDTSTNGTRLNGAAVERSIPVPLRDGDLIEVDQWRLRFSLSVREPDPPSPGG